MRLAKVVVLLSSILLFAASTRSQTPQLLPDQVAKFKQSSTLKPADALKQEGFLNPDAGFAPVESGEVEYSSPKGARVTVEAVRFRQDGEAYELLSRFAAAARAKGSGVEIGPGYGTAGFVGNDGIAFFKGAYFVRVRNPRAEAAGVREFASQLGDSLDKGEGDIPALIKHLPGPEDAQKNAIYLNSFADLNSLGLQQGVLSAVQSGGNADAVVAAYAQARVLIIEFNTPQLATENDQRIIARIHELWNLGQPAPTAYRRVGNYSVFVFDAPDETSAKQLIDGVKYEQVVSWLGDNPNILKEAQKQYINTTLGVLVAVLKASGYALVGCLGMGGLIGGLLFTYRRAQKSETAFSDAGGMLRLNLDELTAETDPARLLRERN